MGELINRPSINQDWISLIFFCNLIIIFGLHYSDTNRFRDLMKFYSSNIYFSKYISDRNLTFKGSFNILSSFLVFYTLSNLLMWGIKQVSDSIFYPFEFYYVLFCVVLFGLFRFIIVQFVMKQINQVNKINIYHFKSFTHATQFSILFIFILFFNNYSGISSKITLGVIASLSLLWLTLQTSILFSFIKSYPRDLFYLIFYLCAVKIAPWFWFYYMIIQPRL